MAATTNTLWGNRSHGASSRPRFGQDRSVSEDGGAASGGGIPDRTMPPARDGAGGFRVLVANAPLSYRQAMAAAITVLRPDVEILLVDPEALDLEVARSSPDLVVCSRVTPTVEAGVGAWVDLYPEGERRATVSIDGRRVETTGVELDDLLSLIDQRAGLAEPRG